jgi:hypothetical protein
MTLLLIALLLLSVSFCAKRQQRHQQHKEEESIHPHFIEWSDDLKQATMTMPRNLVYPDEPKDEHERHVDHQHNGYHCIHDQVRIDSSATVRVLSHFALRY